MAKIREQTLASTTGAQIHLRTCLTKKTPKAVIQINHGLTEHSGRYEHFMKFLAKHGYHSYAHDHRGHGLTKAEKLPFGQFSKRDGGRKVIKDVRFINQMIQSAHQDLPIVCFGHSMGGQIATNYVLQNPNSAHALAVWNTNFTISQYASFAKVALFLEAFFKGSDVPSLLMSKMTFEAWSKSIKNSKTGYDWLTHDEEMIEKIANDELGGWPPSIEMWRAILDFILKGANTNAIKALDNSFPIQLVGGEQDPATEFGKAVEWYAELLENCGKTNVQMIYYPDCRHETLNETSRDVAMSDFVDWVDKTVDNG
jgi:alpha-beta hydrolase superfamily lysophospholipase